MEVDSPLAVWTQTEEFQTVPDVLEAVLCPDLAIIEIGEATRVQFYDRRATGANEMVVMTPGIVPDKFKTRGTLAKVEPLHDPDLFEQSQGAIYGGQVAITRR